MPHVNGIFPVNEEDMMLRNDSAVAGFAGFYREMGLDEKVVEKMCEGDGSSRPPSPPESGASTPRLSISPCPARLRPLIPPPNYGTVELHQIYRSSFPQDRNMDFVRSLKVRSVLNLVDTEPSEDYQTWLQDNNIKQLRIDIATNKDGKINTTIDSLCEALLFLSDSSNHPVYIHCNQGKHRTGCVVACLRKIQGLPMEEILGEYNAYAGLKAREGDIALIESFKPAAVFQYAAIHGYLEGEKRHLCDGLVGGSRKDSQYEDEYEDIVLAPA